MAIFLAFLFSVVAITQFTTADKSTRHSGLKTPPVALPLLQEASDEWLLQEEAGQDPAEIAGISDVSCDTPTQSFTIPSLTELPTPLPDLLVVLVAFACFGISCRLRSILHAIARKEPRHPQVPVESTDAFGCTKLHVAAHAGLLEEVQSLLKCGSNPNAQEAWDETPLHMASRAGHLQIATLLVAHGADINMRNADDETPLVVAANAGKREVCSYLLEMGAGTGGLEEERLPCLLNSLLMQRMFMTDADSKLKAPPTAAKTTACR
ncbi:Ankyrin-1 [Symbiodinium microadriaticum]|uniref:Ankyrin-1 n=1 Tax=Symbiodinium microadriaticum TaxID=2951 RepID=A0A1Q9D783_SYMMI|nr:Ankyrin-1 [Symbiodinium microadriaticum]